MIYRLEAFGTPFSTKNAFLRSREKSGVGNSATDLRYGGGGYEALLDGPLESVWDVISQFRLFSVTFLTSFLQLSGHFSDKFSATFGGMGECP